MSYGRTLRHEKYMCSRPDPFWTFSTGPFIELEHRGVE